MSGSAFTSSTRSHLFQPKEHQMQNLLDKEFLWSVCQCQNLTLYTVPGVSCCLLATNRELYQSKCYVSKVLLIQFPGE